MRGRPSETFHYGINNKINFQREKTRVSPTAFCSLPGGASNPDVSFRSRINYLEADEITLAIR